MADKDTNNPMNIARQHTANADEYLAKGLIVLAAEEHLKAAEAFRAAVEKSQDDSARRTLLRLHNEHSKAAKELQRRIEALRQEGKDPNLPQKPPPAPPRINSPSNFGIPRAAPSPPPNQPAGLTPQRSVNMAESHSVDESFMLLAGQRSEPGDAFNHFWNIMQGMLDNLSQPVAFATAPLGVETPSSSSTQSSSPASSIPLNLSAPAHTHPPRRGLYRDSSTSGEADPDEPMLSRFSKRLSILTRETSKGIRTSIQQYQQSPQRPVSPVKDDDFDEFLDEAADEDMSESFYVIPGSNEPSQRQLKQENKALKMEVEALRKKLETAERIIQLRKDQDKNLRESILQATREAQRVMSASGIIPRPTPPDLTGLTLNAPSHVPLPGTSFIPNVPPTHPPHLPVRAQTPPTHTQAPVLGQQPQIPGSFPPVPGVGVLGTNTTNATNAGANTDPGAGAGEAKEAQLQQKIQELEEELRSVKAENEKHKAMIVKFRERWEKLKESAKKKKEAKAAAHTPVAREAIAEDPEAEAAAEAE
ncbi:hypothetical protein AX16_010486 [Volvariella volvacea WC 439]|nr:hypothetical protein AX16_010486 [Volvariella volvacea WC 439]